MAAIARLAALALGCAALAAFCAAMIWAGIVIHVLDPLPDPEEEDPPDVQRGAGESNPGPPA